jgi:peptide/nickel transport system substrate-binding protein
MKSTPIDRRSLLSGAFAGAATLTLCPPARAAGPEELRVAQPWEFKTLELAEAGFTFSRAGISETLVASLPDGRIAPGLAQSWTVSDDGLQWRFRLRDAVFHDGTRLDAAVAKASFERLLPQSLYLKRVGIVAIEADGQDLVLKLEKPFGPLLSYLVDNSAALMAPSAFDTAGRVTALIGTGPFKVVSADLPRSLSLVRHEAYWGEKARVAAVRYDAVANGDTRTNIAIANDADIVFNLTAQGVGRAASAGMKIERVIIPRTHILMLNCAKPQFAEAPVRRALSMALDREGIAAGIMRNKALAATQYLPPTLAEWHFADLPPLRQNVAAANALLDAAGWGRGADGIRAKGGVRFAGTVRTFANRPELPVIATAMQAQLRAIGFDLAISVGEWQAIYEGQKDGSLELGLSSRNLVIVPDPIATIALDYAADSIAPGGSGTTGWRHDGLRQEVARYLAEADEKRRATARRTIAGMIHEELPVIPVTWYDQIVAVHPRISGFVTDPLEQRYFLDKVAIAS